MKNYYSSLIPIFNVKLTDIHEKNFNLPKVECYIVGKEKSVGYKNYTLKLLFANCSELLDNKKYNFQEYFPFTKLNPTWNKFHEITAESFLLCVISLEAKISKENEFPLAINDGNVQSEDFINSFLFALKLVTEKNPQFFKIYYSNNDNILNMRSEWSANSMNGTILEIDDNLFNSILEISIKLWPIFFNRNKYQSHRILDNALKYFHLSTIMHESDVILMFLVIAFESLYKKSTDNSLSPARSIFCKLTAINKKEYKVINDFLNEDKTIKGCFYYRNNIVHGDLDKEQIPDDMPLKLMNYTKRGLLQIINLISNKTIEYNNYYNSLKLHAGERFNNLSI